MSRRNPGIKLNGQRNECAGCNELFNSNYAFDKHRTGQFGKPIGMGGRRCMAVAEMMDAGMAKNAAGFWISERMSKDGVSSWGENAPASV